MLRGVCQIGPTTNKPAPKILFIDNHFFQLDGNLRMKMTNQITMLWLPECCPRLTYPLYSHLTNIIFIIIFFIIIVIILVTINLITKATCSQNVQSSSESSQSAHKKINQSSVCLSREGLFTRDCVASLPFFIPHQTNINTLVMPIILNAATNVWKATTTISYFFFQCNFKLKKIKFLSFTLSSTKSVLDLSICG